MLTAICTGVAALKTALELGPGHRIVTIFCDSGMRHLSKFWAQIGDISGDAGVTLDDILNGTDLRAEGRDPAAQD
jgi:cysteine synthase